MRTSGIWSNRAEELASVRSGPRRRRRRERPRARASDEKFVPFANTAQSAFRLCSLPSSGQAGQASPGKTNAGRAKVAWIVIAIFCAGWTVAAQQTVTKPYRNSSANAIELSIVAAKVQMLLSAPNGKKTGFEPKPQKIVKEIPNSSYYQDALLQYDSGRVDPNTTQTIDVKQATPGKYRLIVSQGNAADGEEYEIHVNLYLQPRGETRTARIAGAARRGKVATYDLSVSAVPAMIAVVGQGKQKL
jgi:hypothetical protein